MSMANGASRKTFLKNVAISGGIATASGLVLSSPVTSAQEIALPEDDEEEDPSMRDFLPPFWVPVGVAIALLGGVGLLQLSLGNVADDEAMLGSASGARARKESTRNKKFLD
eukprot:CAMPEP_0113935342 /NCGR_PEP_ID=MMETSP1339-20121228/2496_1 /TAXON_ID=94617 /ORGANISM="Fibrocapsa japonica" /LENGTH=111 /DNA_ID=CAMNT_0000937441 /DNA_START=154 /DNA_END=489 /DNA_ORIENTATION=+ /assembly_acc=CAM_ASM_000762